MVEVSVITPVFNGYSALKQNIESVRNQTVQSYEHIIIDDCSTESPPLSILDMIRDDPKIIFIQRSWNAGPAVTRNRGISAAKGRFIAFLDADDTWYPTKLERQINFMIENNLVLSYSTYEVVDIQGHVLGVRTPPPFLSYSNILKSNQIGCLTAIYDTKAVGKIYMPNIAKRQDMGLWLKILKAGHLAGGIVDVPLARYRIGTSTVSSNKLAVLKYQWRIYREIENLSFIRSLYYFLHYAYKGITRKT